MKIDLTLMPETFDAIHAALAITVVCLLFLLILIRLLQAFQKRKKQADSLRDRSAEAASVDDLSSIQPRTNEAENQISAPGAEVDSALQLLGLLQQDARFVDFLQENVSHYSDQEIGAAARVVHEGCVKVLRQHFDIEPIFKQSEGSTITLPKGFDASSTRLTGNVVGSAPFTGTLVHCGYRAARCELPQLTPGHDARIIAAAEVEL
jgi:hypothetical protein